MSDGEAIVHLTPFSCQAEKAALWTSQRSTAVLTADWVFEGHADKAVRVAV